MSDKRGSRSSVCTLVLVRHAESKGKGTFVGQNDEPLSVEGYRQLKKLTRSLSRFPFDAVFASDLERAVVTARKVVKRRNVKLEIRPNLREMHFGRWQGLSWKQIVQRDPQLSRKWLKDFSSQTIPEAERFAQFKKRTRNEVKAIVDAHRGRCVLAVTHAGVIRVALGDVLGIKDTHLFRLEQDTCSINVVDYFPDGAVVRCVNA